MNRHKQDDGSRKAKNIAAILYLLVLAFLVGGSYIHQHQNPATASTPDSQTPP